MNSVKRVKRGFYETTFQTLAEHPNEFKDYEITDQFLKLLENQIHRDPSQYFWSHNRFKHLRTN